MLLQMEHDKLGYLVRGMATFRTPFATSSGELLAVSGGGLIIQSREPAPAGTDIEVRFRIQGYAPEVEAKGRVVHVHGEMMRILFLEESLPIKNLMLWLETDVVERLLEAA
jgi:hypothetical protein